MGDIELDPEEVHVIAGLTRQVAGRAARSEHLSRAALDEGLFGGIDAGPAVVSVHQEAQRVVTATLAGVGEDLENFATGLELAVEDLLARDAEVEAALNRVSGRLPFTTAQQVEVTTTMDADAVAALGEVTVTGQGEAAREAAIATGGGS